MRSSILLLLLLPPVARAQAPLVYALTSPNAERSGYFGDAVSGVPDADGDGVTDLLVGALREDIDSDPDPYGDRGRAYLYSGATGELLHTLISPNPEESVLFGCSVSGVEDADGDGRGDLLIGSYDGAPTPSRRAYLFSGATGTLLHTLTSNQGGSFGDAVAGVPDADGDGRGDLLIGAVSEDSGMEDAGRAYLYSGATGALLHTLSSPSPIPEHFGYFGRSVSGVDDVDGDGRGDLFIGADGEDGGPTIGGAGRAHLFSGATGVLLHTLSSPYPEDDFSGSFGYSVSGVDDADGDGVPELLVSAASEDGGAVNAGRAYLFSGTSGALLRVLTTPTPKTMAASASPYREWRMRMATGGATSS